MATNLHPQSLRGLRQTFHKLNDADELDICEKTPARWDKKFELDNFTL
jgi:hypothetical protein